MPDAQCPLLHHRRGFFLLHLLRFIDGDSEIGAVHFAQHTAGAGVNVFDYSFSAFPFIGGVDHFQCVHRAHIDADDTAFAPIPVDGDIDAGFIGMPGFFILIG